MSDPRIVLGPAAMPEICNCDVSVVVVSYTDWLEANHPQDLNVLYEYANLSARCKAYGLSLAASRHMITIRDKHNVAVAAGPTVKEVDVELQRQIDAGYYEHMAM